MAVRLNKKVALIGSGVIVLLGLGLIAAVLMITQNPAKFIADGDAAWEQGDFEKAERNYLRAKARTKDNESRIGVIKKLIDVYFELEDWPPIRGLWQETLKIKPEDYPTRYARLKYFYIICDSGAGKQLWGEVETQATEFIELLNDQDLAKDTSKWENPYYEKVGLVHEPLAGDDGVQRIGQYLYLLRGKARLNLASSGAVTEPDMLLDDAVDDLNRAAELEPTNSEIAEILAQVYITKGNIAAKRGLFDEKEAAQQKALNILKNAVEMSPNDPKANMSLLLAEQNIQLSQAQNISGREILATYEQKYLDLSDKFQDSDLIQAALAQYYYRMGPNYIDKAIKAIEKAKQLNTQNVFHSVILASYYDYKSAINKDHEIRKKAIQILEETFGSPEIKDTEGPQKIRNINNRLAVYSKLAWLYLDTILNDPEMIDEETKKMWLESAENAIYEIEQMYGSGEDPKVIKWQGVLDLAKGNSLQGIKKLYAIFQQQKAANKVDTQLAYFLAKEMQNSDEFGAVADFYAKALKIGPDDRDNPDQSIVMQRPDTFLDYAVILLKAKAPRIAANIVSSFEREFGKTERSNNILINTLIDAGEFERAKENLENIQTEDTESLQLKIKYLLRKSTITRGKIANERLSDKQSDIKLVDEDGEQEEKTEVDLEELENDMVRYNNELVPIVKKLMEIRPDSINESVILTICRDIENFDNKQKAENFAKYYLDNNPNNIAVNFYLQILRSPEKLTQKQQEEIRNDLILKISDPLERALRLGQIYREKKENDKAKEQFLIVFNNYVESLNSDSIDEAKDQMGKMSISYLFETAMELKDWELAEEIISVVDKQNIDECNGDFFRARLAIVEGNDKEALDFLRSCLDKKPVFSRVYLMRGQINQKLGRLDEAIADFKQAGSLNPYDSTTVRSLAVALYKRNTELGENVTTDQYIEAKQAIERAISINRNDIQLLSFYAYYVKDDDPQNALSILQRIYRFSPTVDNALRLANLASELALKEINNSKKQALLQLAQNTYEDALKADPANSYTISEYARFFRSIGKEEEAEKLIERSEDKGVVWKYYINSGRYKQAKEILEQLHEQQPQDPNIVIGLLVVAERTVNPDDFKKMSEILIQIDDTKKNRLIQVSGMINTGLIEEADLKLQSYMEKYKDDPKALILASEIALKQGKIDEALELANKSIENEEDRAYSWYLRGLINMNKADYSQAINDINKSRSIEENAQSRIALARAYILSNRIQDAKTELAAIAYEPTTPNVARLLLEYVYYQSQDDAGLRNFYQQIINEFPESVFWYNKAADYSDRKGNYTVAQQLYNLAWEKSNQQQRPNVNSLVGYLFSLVENNQLQQALEQAQKYLDSPYAHLALMTIAKVKNVQGDVEESFNYFKKALDAVGDNTNLAVNILMEMGNTIGKDKVNDYCIEKLNSDPDSLVANYIMARLALSNKDFNKSITYLDKCIEIVGQQSSLAQQYLSEKANILGMVFNRTSDNKYFEDAIELWQYLLKRNPDDIGTLNNIAYMMASNDKELGKALEYAEKAQRLSPDNPSILDTYAYVLYKNGRFELAEQYVLSSIQRFEDRQAYAPVDVYEHLGMIKEKLKDVSGAIEAYKKAIESGGEDMSNEQSQRLNDALLRIANQ